MSQQLADIFMLKDYDSFCSQTKKGQTPLKLIFFLLDTVNTELRSHCLAGCDVTNRWMI